MILLDDMLVFITQDDVVHRRMFNQGHRTWVPNFGVYIKAEINGKIKYYAVSRQMVLFAVERRKAWRMLQSKAGVVNKDYLAQKALLKKIDGGQLPLAEAQGKTKELFEAEFAAIK
jgi:pyruvate-ferredoxin/flavodoxin oxidoreductase